MCVEKVRAEVGGENQPGKWEQDQDSFQQAVQRDIAQKDSLS